MSFFTMSTYASLVAFTKGLQMEINFQLYLGTKNVLCIVPVEIWIGSRRKIVNYTHAACFTLKFTGPITGSSCVRTIVMCPIRNIGLQPNLVIYYVLCPHCNGDGDWEREREPREREREVWRAGGCRERDWLLAGRTYSPIECPTTVILSIPL